MSKIKGRPAAHNSTGQYLSKFNHKFDIEEAYIDCKEMGKNFPNGLIPLKELALAVDSVHGPWQGRINQYSNNDPVNQALTLFNLVPHFEMIPIDKVFTHYSSNRDTSPNHCLKLEMDWFDQFAMCNLGLKLPEQYGGIVINADSTHTGVNRIRKGDTELPFWVAEIPDQGDYDRTFLYALFVAGHLFLAINVRNKRNADIFDQHFIKVACGIFPAPQIQNIVNSVSGVQIRRGGKNVAKAIHNLNETYLTYELDRGSAFPGSLLKESLEWQVNNFPHQSIDGCLLTSYAMLILANQKQGIVWNNSESTTLAQILKNRYNTARNIQLKIKEAYVGWNNSNYASLDNNYLVSNGLKHICRVSNIPSARDEVHMWNTGF